MVDGNYILYIKDLIILDYLHTILFYKKVLLLTINQYMYFQ